VAQLPQSLHKVDAKQAGVEHRHRPRIDTNGINKTDQTAAHIDNTQLNNRGHHHRNDDERRADIAEYFKIKIHFG
jgi:hypothetical protein